MSISTFDSLSPIGDHLAWQDVVVSATGGAWQTGSRAIYWPVLVPTRFTAKQMAWRNGSTVSGNIDVGIYDERYNRLSALGGTAQTGTNVIQIADISDIELAPGLYYLAMVLDNTTGTVFRSNSGLGTTYVAVGVGLESSAYPLPATATFAATNSAYVAYLGAVGGSTI